MHTFLIKTFESLYRKTNTYVAVKVIKNVEKYRFVHVAFESHQYFSQEVLLEGQSDPWRLVLGANFLGKGPIDNNW